jgi:hypothetical protein
MVSGQAYFAAAERRAVPVAVEYATGRLARGIPEDQRERIGAFVVHPDAVTVTAQRLGGSWHPCGRAPDLPLTTTLAQGERPDAYELAAYCRDRRLPAAERFQPDVIPASSTLSLAMSKRR